MSDSRLRAQAVVMLWLFGLQFLAVFLGTLALFLRSLGRSGRGWRWASGIAAFFTLGALFNGLSFLDFDEDFSSMIMAACWLIAVSLTVFLVARSPRPLEAGAAPAG